MSDLEKYRLFSEHEKTIPLFSKGWWMDAVCPDEWNVILIEENERINAALPYYLKQEIGLKAIQKAPLTQNQKVWIRFPEEQKYEKKLSYEMKMLNAVIEKIEQMNLTKYQQYLHYSLTNWLPFFWKGYSQTTRYTYVIYDTSNMEQLYNNLNSNVRKLIRKAKKLVQVKENLSIGEFFDLNRMTFERHNMAIPYSFEIVSRIDQQCKERNARKILYCVDENDKIHAAAYFVWDEESVYYLMSGSVPEFRHSQSLTLLLYEGIKLAHKLGKKFDFEGSMKKNIEHHFRQFGAMQVPYHNIFKEF
ncbi:GNAT family N-acetyltransferase [Ureibacillus acetophenoni]|uniref:Acetyltransferase (GNAT) family protein n=1 Tax=Ureibacillus acetophenoni TaxID=614649 RepID=A0A285UDM8_9BACL|nr:GNAT family N-acetyltransferase [Ureibacillus acetophenoni]SOC38411.1 acetyltransferase (GNAT) family protein [Ureibacillus acetophenoni]